MSQELMYCPEECPYLDQAPDWCTKYSYHLERNEENNKPFKPSSCTLLGEKTPTPKFKAPTVDEISDAAKACRKIPDIQITDATEYPAPEKEPELVTVSLDWLCDLIQKHISAEILLHLLNPNRNIGDPEDAPLMRETIKRLNEYLKGRDA